MAKHDAKFKSAGPLKTVVHEVTICFFCLSWHCPNHEIYGFIPFVLESPSCLCLFPCFLFPSSVRTRKLPSTIRGIRGVVTTPPGRTPRPLPSPADDIARLRVLTPVFFLHLQQTQSTFADLQYTHPPMPFSGHH